MNQCSSARNYNVSVGCVHPVALSDVPEAPKAEGLASDSAPTFTAYMFSPLSSHRRRADFGPNCRTRAPKFAEVLHMVENLEILFWGPIFFILKKRGVQNHVQKGGFCDSARNYVIVLD